MVLAMLLLMLLPGIVRADAIKLGDLWINNVTVDTFDGAELHYLVNTTANKRLLADISGFKLAAYPQLELAEKALDAGNTKEALANFKIARARAREVWLRTWLDGKLVPLMDKEGESLEAVNRYLSLLETKAPAAFLQTPPIRSVKALNKDDRAKVNERFKTARKGLTDKTPLADAIDELIELSDPASEPTPVGSADDMASIVALPAFMLREGDNITRMLQRGRFEQALNRIDDELKTAAGGGKTSLLLYQRGICQYYLAVELEKDASKKAAAKTLFEDAGLSFYRIPTYFKTSSFVGPALVETAAVHVKINRFDVAAKLLGQARAQIDPDDALMAARMNSLDEIIAKATQK